MNKHLIVSLELLNSITAYLGTRPYQEVYQLINAIQSAAQNQPKAEVPNGDQVDSESN